MDMNSSSLAYAAHRIERYQPQIYQQNILRPISEHTAAIDKFDSIAINYLLYCLPGRQPSKAVVFKHLKTLMKPGATLFDATILLGSAPRRGTAQQLMKLNNRKGIFSNQHDYLKDLETGINQYFESARIEMRGCVALFSAQCPTKK